MYLFCAGFGQVFDGLGFTSAGRTLWSPSQVEVEGSK